MDRIIGTLLFLDAAIQRRFDAFIFILMRRFGWQKSIIRYALWGFMVIVLLIHVYCKWIIGGHKLQWGLIYDGLWILPFTFYQRRDYQYDRASEGGIARSFADVRLLQALQTGKLLICMCLILYANFVGVCWLSSKERNPYIAFVEKVDDVSFTFFLLIMLAILYLVRTPPAAPPEKEKAGSLVPAPQHSS